MMEKQWSTDMRNGPEGSLAGMEIWDFRSWKRNAAITTGSMAAMPLASCKATGKLAQIRASTAT